MKTIVTTISLCFLSSVFYGQKLAINSGSFKTEDITSSPFKIITGYDKEFDEAVKFAFDKYWKISPLKYIPKDKKNYYGNFWIESFKSNTAIKKTWTYCKFNVPNITSDVLFDDYTKGGQTIGIEQNFHMMAIKVIPLIMCFNAEVKRVIELGETKWGGAKYARREKLKTKIKDYTVLIPKEDIASGRFTETAFTSSLKNCSFLTSDEIYKKIKEQNGVENTALLVVGRNDYQMYLSIIDIKTGDLLYEDGLGLSTFTKGKEYDDDVIIKFLKGIEEK